MIFDKNVNFPYPVYTNWSNEYKEPYFDFDVDLSSDTSNYYFDISTKIESKYIRNLIKTGKAQLILVIQSYNNMYFTFDKMNNISITIPKNQLALSNRTKLQLMVKALEEITMKDNEDLEEFYNMYKSDIIVNKNNVLAISDTIAFDGNIKKPLDMFTKIIDNNIDSDVEIRLEDDSISLVFKNEKIIAPDNGIDKENYYMYIYASFQKALMNFILTEQRKDCANNEIYISDITDPSSILNEKLLFLMKAKKVEVISVDNIDEVIFNISDNVISKYNEAMRLKLDIEED